MQHDDPWTPDTTGHPATTDPETVSLQEALLALDHKAAPVFAVLDGAQFDNLPQSLLLGDFISRPLYIDRGDNNPEQIITAPHMVWLEERGERATGRPPVKTIPALLALIADRPAAVFWQCPAGADALYKHLRGINMVLYPREVLEDVAELQDPAEAAAPDTHELSCSATRMPMSSRRRYTHWINRNSPACSGLLRQFLPTRKESGHGQSARCLSPNLRTYNLRIWDHFVCPRPKRAEFHRLQAGHRDTE